MTSGGLVSDRTRGSGKYCCPATEICAGHGASFAGSQDGGQGRRGLVGRSFATPETGTQAETGPRPGRVPGSGEAFGRLQLRTAASALLTIKRRKWVRFVIFVSRGDEPGIEENTLLRVFYCFNSTVTDYFLLPTSNTRQVSHFAPIKVFLFGPLIQERLDIGTAMPISGA